MNDVLSITSLQNPKVKSFLKLYKRRERDLSKKFIIEGYRELSRAIEEDVKVEQIFFCPDLFLGTNERSLLEKAKEAELIECTKAVFEKLSYRDRPDGLIARAEQLKHSLESLEKSFEERLKKYPAKAPFLVVAESIEKPGNLGTILRSCDAAGVDAVIVCDRCTDLHNPNVVRASVGTLFTQKVLELDSKELLAFLTRQKIRIIAASPDAKELFTEASLQGAIAIFVGTEQYGLSKTWMQFERVRIPMKGRADSLNVATATSLLLYEALRQRGG